jgi:hypothetical protein
MRTRRIAILGNMNNNGFALLRYFREAGEDADLLLYHNDGRGTLSHFNPESDCWDYEKWSQFVHRIPVVNGFVSVPSQTIGSFLWPFWVLWSYFRGNAAVSSVVSDAHIRRILGPYTHIVGSGVAPAICHRAGRQLDIFFPYSLGVEFVESSTIRAWQGVPGFSKLRPFLRAILRNQILGIKASKHVLNFDQGSTEEVLSDLGVKSKPIGVPMVFTDELDELEVGVPEAVGTQLLGLDFSCGSFARHLWSVKGNENFLREFAQFRHEHQEKNIRLFLSNYGPDVPRSKALILDLDVEDSVIWMPILPRKIVRILAPQFDVLAGEFHAGPRTIWGGTGWEALAYGVPFIQGFNFIDGEFEDLSGTPEPPILKVQHEGDIHKHLTWCLTNPAERAELSSANRAWFDLWGGKHLARRWLDFL